MDDESSSISTAESGMESPIGKDTELVRIAAAELSLMGRDRRSVISIRSGEFVGRVIRQWISPLSVAICSVGDHQWPIAKDSPVLRVGPRRFSFAFPAFFYGLTLPDSCSEEELKRVEDTLSRFCAYEDCSAKQADPNLEMPEVENGFWGLALPSIDNLSSRMLEKIIGGGRPRLNAWVGDSNSISNQLQKAIRMSAVVKLISKALLKGAIDLNLHVGIMRPQPPAPNSDVCASVSIRAFTDVVDAVETAGRSITANADRPIIWANLSYWIFNKSGLALLLRALAATAVVHIARNSIAAANRRVGSGSEFAGPVNELISDSCLSG